MTVGGNPLISEIRGSLWRRDDSKIVLISGKTGSGKSGCALTLAMGVDREFAGHMDKFIVFTSAQLIDLVNYHLDNNISLKGRAIIFDEAGQGFAARQFFKKSNIEGSFLLQTFRFLNTCLIMTVPRKFMIDRHGRALYHIDIETKQRTPKYVTIKWKNIPDNFSSEREAYGRFNRIRDHKGKVMKESHTRIHRPPEEIERVYKKMKKEYMIDLYKTMAQTKEEMKEASKPKEHNARCKKCEYTWHYTGSALKTRCSQCGGQGEVGVKIPTPLI